MDGWMDRLRDRATWEGEENFQTFVYTWRHFFYHLKLLWNKKPYLHRHFLLFVSKRYVIIIIINVVLPPSILVFSVRISDERVDSYTQTSAHLCCSLFASNPTPTRSSSNAKDSTKIQQFFMGALWDFLVQDTHVTRSTFRQKEVQLWLMKRTGLEQ